MKLKYQMKRIRGYHTPFDGEGAEKRRIFHRSIQRRLNRMLINIRISALFNQPAASIGKYSK